MATTKTQRSAVFFWLALFIAAYVVVSAGLAIATSDNCDSVRSADGSKTWAPVPPHWECTR